MFTPRLAGGCRLVLVLTTFCAACIVTLSVKGAGVTLITHGFSGDVQGWVSGMADNIPRHPQFPGTNIICYEVTVSYSGGFVVTPRKLSGGNPTNDFSAEIVIKLDWSDLAGFFAQYDTYEVAAAVVPRFLQTNFIAELGGHALAELPIHLVGHSRGGSLVCQLSRLLGTNGVWVDQVTTLDPHPVNEDGNADPLVVSDAPLRIYESVLFADNYYQEFGGYPHGQMMPSSYNRRFAALPGGYSSAHSDTHLWYHGTIDLREPANDTEALLSVGDRTAWYATAEMRGARAGFYYARMNDGNRLGLDQPAGTGTDRPAEGYNQRWNLGAGTSANRTSLPGNAGNWPNVITVNLTGTNLMAQGQSNTVAFRYQWAKPEASNATVNLYLDDDFNPWNGNERLLRPAAVSGTTSTNMGIENVVINVTTMNSTPGVHSLCAKISGGGRTRYLYSPELVTVVSSLQPPVLAIMRDTASRVRVDIDGIPGQRIVLHKTTDLQTWDPIATNWLTAERWSYFDATTGNSRRFYRAQLW